jgi:hypothetical protein
MRAEERADMADDRIAELEAEVARLRETLEYARPLVAKWCHYQGDSKRFHEETLRPIDAALAQDRGK